MTKTVRNIDLFRPEIPDDHLPVKSRIKLAVPGVASKKCHGPLHPDGGVYLTMDSFYKNKHRPDGVRTRCKDCSFYDLKTDRQRNNRAKRKYDERQRFLQGGVRPPSGASDALERFVDGGSFEIEEDEAKARLDRFINGSLE